MEKLVILVYSRSGELGLANRSEGPPARPRHSAYTLPLPLGLSGGATINWVSGNVT